MIRRPCWMFRLFGRCRHKPDWYGLDRETHGIHHHCAKEAARAKQLCGHCGEPMGVTPYYTYEDDRGRPLHHLCYWEPVDNDPDRAAMIVRSFLTGTTQELSK